MAFPFMQMFMPFNNFNHYYYQPAPNPFAYNQGYPNSVFENQSKIKGRILYQNALAGLPAESPNPPLCARYVKNAIVNSGLGVYEYGNGEQTKYMLRKNPNFREVKVRGEDLKYLPEGTVITYDAYDSGVGPDGHVVVKGQGEYAISDRFENFIIPSDNAHTFILA